MKVKQILYTKKFASSVKKLPKKLKEKVIIREALFRENPFHPSLKTHQLKGKLKDLWSFSLSYSYRVLFEFVENNEILFHDVGTHSIYK